MINSFEELNFKSYNNNLKNKLNKSPTFRIYILLFTFIFAFIVIGIQMVLMAINPTSISDDRKVNFNKKFDRKDIIDKNGVLLATNVKVNSLYAHPSEIIDKEKVVNSLIKIFPDSDIENLKKKIYGNKPFVWLRKTISPEQQNLVYILVQEGCVFIQMVHLQPTFWVALDMV